MVNDNMMSRFALTLKLCWHYIAILSVLAAVLYLVYPALSFIPVVLIAFVLFFFRNPKREVPPGENCILSPADGMIMEIDEVVEDRFIQGPAIRISIFLSILNVHLNRAPLPGEVRYRYYRPGKFIPAFKSHASDINEKNFIGIESGGFKVMVCQITGFIARRIKCWADEGNSLAGGELIGIIKFGSGTEIFIPTGSLLYVNKGDRVKAGETVLGMLPGLNDNK